MGQDKIAQQENKEIQPEAVDADNRGIKDLCSSISWENECGEHRDPDPSTDIPKPVSVDSPHKHKQHRKQPQQLNVPKHSDSACNTDQYLRNQRYTRIFEHGVSKSNIYISLQKLECNQSDRRRH